MKRISDHRESGAESCGESPQGDDVVESVREIQRLVSECRQPEHDGQDRTGDATSPMREELDDLLTQVREAREELVQLRDANRTLESRLETIEQTSQAAAEAFTPRPTLEALESIRQELGVAHELFEETRGKYDRAIADLISQFASGQPVPPTTADHHREHTVSGLRVAGNRASEAEPVGWRTANDSDCQRSDESDVSAGAPYREGQWHRSAGTDSVAAPGRDEASREEAQYSVWSHTQESLADDRCSDVESDREDSEDKESRESNSDGHWTSKVEAAGVIDAVPPDDSDGATMEMSDDDRVSLWGKHAMRMSSATARAREADFSIESDQFLSEPKADSPTEMHRGFGFSATVNVDEPDHEDGPAVRAEEQESEDSINDYMNRLLRRVGADTDDSIQEAVSELLTHSSHLQQLVEANAETLSNGTPKHYAIDLAPRSLPPEKRLGLAVMRDIANTSARHAIKRSVRKQTHEKKVEARLQFLYSGAAIVCGVTLYYTAGQLPRLLAIALILMIAICFAREGLLALLDARRRSKVAEACDAMSDSPPSCESASESPSSGEDDRGKDNEDHPAETVTASTNGES